MPTTIKLKNSVTTTNVPSSLAQGEVAINVTDKKVWVGNAATTPVQLLGTGSDGSFTNLTVSGTTALNGGTTLGDASGDALTINSSAVSIPNGLNFDSNTFVIDATNNRVGVGTASPAYALSVVGSIIDLNGAATYPAIQLRASSNTSTIFSIGRGSSAEGYLATSGSNPIYFSTNATERMRIDTSGNVGIGTSSPAEILTIKKGNGGIRLDADGTVSANTWVDYYVTNNGGVSTSSNFAGRVYATSSGTTNFSDNSIRIAVPVGGSATPVDTLIVKGGNVGIGATSPNYKITVNNGASASVIQLCNTASGTTSNDGLLIYQDGVNCRFQNTEAGNISLFTGNTERAVLNSDGNLGLAVTPAAWGATFKALQVNTGPAIWSDGTRGFYSSNLYYNGTNRIYQTTGVALEYSQGASGHVWSTAASGTAGNNVSLTQAMTLDASGNLALGTTSPVSLGGYTVQTLNNATNGSGTYYQQNGTSVGRVIATTADLYIGAIKSSGNLIFESSGTTERMRIDGSGNLLVGKTSTNGATVGVELLPSGLATFTRSGGYPLYVRRNTNDGDVAVWINNAGSVVGAVTISGSTTTYNTSSDYRLKENIAPMTGALAVVSALKPVTYKWKTDGSDGQGFIAHELQEIVPDCVTGVKDGLDEEGNPKYQGIDTSFLVATLTAAIQEQQAIINDLKARIETLESK
jgi:hypothetical protein